VETHWPWVSGHDWCGEHPDFPSFIASRKATQASSNTHSVKNFELAQRFVNGETITSIADSLGVTPPCARQKIWRVFKTINRTKYDFIESRYNRTPSSRQLRTMAAEFGFATQAQSK